MRVLLLSLFVVPVVLAAPVLPVPKYKPSAKSPVALDITQNAYGYSDTAPMALEIGDKAPDFVAPGVHGSAVALAELRGRGPVVLIFYRGHW